MKLFRPERKVTDPEGRAWEVYVSRFSLRALVGLAHDPRVVGVEAVSFFPGRTRHRWTTTSDHVESVVEQVARGLEVGEIVRPLGAVYKDPRLKEGQGPPSFGDG